jgi:hypothetical protein
MILSPRTAITIEGNRPVGGAAPSPLLNGLVSYWKLDELSGTRVDQLGVNNLSPINAPPGVPGIIGNAVSLTSASNQALASGLSSNLVGGAQDFAYSFWIKTTSVATQAIIDKSNGGDHLVLLTGGLIRWEVKGFATDVFSAGPVNDDAWHNVIVWYDFSTDQKVRLTVDNGAVQVGAASTASPTNGAEWMIGSLNNTALPLDGLIDETGRWNLSPDATFRSLIWNGGAGRTYPFL